MAEIKRTKWGFEYFSKKRGGGADSPESGDGGVSTKFGSGGGVCMHLIYAKVGAGGSTKFGSGGGVCTRLIYAKVGAGGVKF